ncbi:hypothetical protein, partial [Geomonas silvestris]|uniref:hypothetical protein n=1 Tax=Geomonas silvestris TaxID=2740184 RepID=UPI001AD8DF61
YVFWFLAVLNQSIKQFIYTGHRLPPIEWVLTENGHLHKGFYRPVIARISGKSPLFSLYFERD